MPTPLSLLDIDAKRFQREGYLVLKNVVPQDLADEVSRVIARHLDPLVAPVEFEADVGYPGAPENRQTRGGQTPRRLLHAFARDQAFAQLAQLDGVVRMLQGLLGDTVWLSQCHHNCVMTKYPGYSSATLWHEDIRYWSFDKPELISAWFALGGERRQNGALRIIPRSHLLELDRGRLDGDLFLRPELRENKALMQQSIEVGLAAGDVLLFHCRLFHAAGKNRSELVKLTPVFTYHAGRNKPIPGTRSAQWPSILISDAP